MTRYTILFIISLFVLGACSTTRKHVSEHFVSTDSMETRVQTRTDTIRVTTHDTLYVREIVQETTRTHVELDNGTLDVRNGIVSGIKSIDLTRELQEEREARLRLLARMEASIARYDSISERYKSMEREKEQKKEKSKSTIAWIVAMLALTILICLYFRKTSK